MAKREKVYLKDLPLYDEIDHSASSEQFSETYAKLDTLTRGSSKKLVWKCSIGHSWQAAIKSRSNGHGCRPCGAAKSAKSRGVPKKGNSLADMRPDLVLDWDFSQNSKKPDEVNYGSNSKFWWICHMGHAPYMASVTKRVGGTGCKLCGFSRTANSRSKPKKGMSLSELHPEISDEWDRATNTIDPSEVPAQANWYANWICSEGHSWKAKVSNRTNGTGCPTCARQSRKIEHRLLDSFSKSDVLSLVEHGMRLNQLKYESGRSGVEVDLVFYYNHHYLLIEYDGSYWHRDKAASDMEKSRLLLSLGDNILHVRIRENDLPNLDLDHDRFAQFQHDYHATEDDSIERTVKEIERWFLEKIGE